MTIRLSRGDLPAEFEPGKAIAIDTETLGLKPARDKLCLVQISNGDGNAQLIQVDRASYAAPRLKALLEDASITKIFHYARFDVAVLKHYLGAETKSIYCTKIASRLARTFSNID